MFAGKDNYIDGVSKDSHIKAKQLWQFLTSKVLYRILLISQGHKVCDVCGCHAQMPPIFNYTCEPINTYTVEDFPEDNLALNYRSNTYSIKGCHKLVFS